MNNAHAIVLRSVGSCLRSSTWPKSLSTLSRALRPILRHQQPLGISSQLSGRQSGFTSFVTPSYDVSRRQFSATTANRFGVTVAVRALGPLKPQDVERGLTFGEKPLSDNELEDIFELDTPPFEQANRLLRVLHGRRVDGTLDLPFPDDLQELVESYPDAPETALHWLRENYDIDEDEAIVARIEREESGYDGKTPSQLRQRAQDLKLYAPQPGKIDEYRRTAQPQGEPEYVGPQSGKYQAKLSEKGDVFGESQIENIRTRNEAEFKKEEEQLNQQIEEIQARRVAAAEEAKSKALAAKPDQNLEVVNDEVRPPNSFERWTLRAKNRATSDLTLDSPEIKDRTLLSRLLPSFGFVLLVGAGCYLLSEYWTPPKRKERLWPSMSLSFATIAGIIAVNVGVFVMWKFPPAWSLLNRYFLVVHATPNPLSLVGNIFSHVSFSHLILNMIPLLVFGPSLHEDMGRGNFMALYLFSGVVGGFASLARHAASGILYTTSLGASGSVWATTAAFFCLHSHNNFTVFFMPEEWKETIHIKGWALFTSLILFDLVRGIRGRPVTIDYVAHAGGALVGWGLAEYYKWKQARSRSRDFVPKTTDPWWQVILQEGKNQEKGT